MLAAAGKARPTWAVLEPWIRLLIHHPLALTHFHQDEVISKAFSGRHGPAYLVHSMVNVYTGDSEERQLTTGKHVVADLHCKGCREVIGWKYISASERDQRYKEGRFAVEYEKLHKDNQWG